MNGAWLLQISTENYIYIFMVVESTYVEKWTEPNDIWKYQIKWKWFQNILFFFFFFFRYFDAILIFYYPS